MYNRKENESYEWQGQEKTSRGREQTCTVNTDIFLELIAIARERQQKCEANMDKVVKTHACSRPFNIHTVHPACKVHGCKVIPEEDQFLAEHNVSKSEWM